MPERVTDSPSSYFRKFVKSWNKGRLSSKYYRGTGVSQEAASASTSYKWGFAERVSEKDIKAAREVVRDATNASMPSSSRPVQGPTLPESSAGPSSSDKQWDRELLEEKQQRERQASRKRARVEENDRIEDAIGPRDVGREKVLENKKARRENDRSFRDKDNEPDVDVDALMAGDSFQARWVLCCRLRSTTDSVGRLAQRDAARKRFEQKRGGDREAKEQANRERVDALKAKDQETMAMLQALAKQRYG